MAKEISSLKVEGMSCSHCENSVKKSVGALNGVEKVIVDLKAKKVTIEYDFERVNIQTIKDTIEDQGYEVKE
jgi:copper chaperone